MCEHYVGSSRFIMSVIMCFMCSPAASDVQSVIDHAFHVQPSSIRPVEPVIDHVQPSPTCLKCVQSLIDHVFHVQPSSIRPVEQAYEHAHGRYLTDVGFDMLWTCCTHICGGGGVFHIVRWDGFVVSICVSVPNSPCLRGKRENVRGCGGFQGKPRGKPA